MRERSIASFRRRTQRLKGHASNEPKEKLIREVVIPEAINIQELANRMSERAVDVIRLLMKQGAMHKITDVIDADTAQLIAEEMGHTVKRVAASDVEEGLFDVVDDSTDTEPRSPVVTVMGHVDHGKTSLLDALRHANVVSGEAGGITQHIGAYQVTSPESGKKITFIDTPGHAAFTAMRARGAKVTDIVVLVVAADDGVMPQTVEAINHAKAAKVPMIVAINKIDKPDARPERVRTELLQHEVQVESLGGDVVDVEVSAKNKTNLDKLLEMIALQAELLDLKTNAARPAEGTVIEAKLDRGRGPVATVLVQRGTLRVGDIVVAGAEMGRVRALISDQGDTVEEAGPSVPVEVLGFNGPPEAGDRLAVVENEARARQITSYRAHQKRENAAASISGMRGSLEQMMSQLKTSGRKEFPLIVKADVQGSLEAILGSLEKLGTDEVAARILHAGVGGISESDVTLAEGFNAAIIGFSVRANKEAAAAAKRNGIEIRYYNIIYDLVDDVKKAMCGLLAPTLRETMLGNAQILEVFNISKVGKVAGCRVTDGTVERGANVRLIRDNVVVHEGKLSTLKRFKDEVKEVQSGQECGMAFENYGDMRVGDVIECYRVETIQRSPVSPNLTKRCEFQTKSRHAPRLVRASTSHRRQFAARKTWMPAIKRGHDDYSRISTMPRHHKKSSAPGGSQRQLRVGETVRHAMADILVAGQRARPRPRGPHHHRARGADVAGPEACDHLCDAARRPRHRQVVIAALERNKKFLRGEVARRVNLKFAPDIRFRVDDRFDEAERIEKLLRTPAVQRDLAPDSGSEE